MQSPEQHWRLLLQKLLKLVHDTHCLRLETVMHREFEQQSVLVEQVEPVPAQLQKPIPDPCWQKPRQHCEEEVHVLPCGTQTQMRSSGLQSPLQQPAPAALALPPLHVPPFWVQVAVHLPLTHASVDLQDGPPQLPQWRLLVLTSGMQPVALKFAPQKVWPG